jgi:hypothetical protein
MAQAIAFSRTALLAARDRQADMLSGVVVLSSAAALIFAGQPLPI